MTNLSPTLDDQRTDALRAWLTDKATDVPVAPPHHGRRVAVGVVAAAILAGALFTAASITGRPDSGLTLTPVEGATAEGLKMTSASTGWIRVSIADIDADPYDIIAQLNAKGIDARAKSLKIRGDEVTAYGYLSEFDESVSTGLWSIEPLTGKYGWAGIEVVDESAEAKADQAALQARAEAEAPKTDEEVAAAIAEDEDGSEDELGGVYTTGNIRSDYSESGVVYLRPSPDLHVAVVVKD